MKNMSVADKKQIEALDKKIERLKEKIIIKRREYDELTGELQKLLDERYPERKTERVKQTLYDAYIKSEKSLESVLEFMENQDDEGWR